MGPPPPSPWPNGTSERLAAPLSLKFAAAWASSALERVLVYVSTGGKWVSTRVPSMPSHQKVWCGKTFTRFHEIFWVRNHRQPACRTSWGSAAV